MLKIMKKTNRVKYPHKTTTFDSDSTTNVEVCDPCAIVMLYDDRPLVLVFNEDGYRTDCEQFASMAEVGPALVRAKNGGKLVEKNLEVKISVKADTSEIEKVRDEVNRVLGRPISTGNFRWWNPFTW